MLDGARSERTELQAQLRTAIAGATNLKHKVKLSTMATDNRRMITKSKDFRGMEEGMDHVRYVPATTSVCLCVFLSVSPSLPLNLHCTH